MGTLLRWRRKFFLWVLFVIIFGLTGLAWTIWALLQYSPTEDNINLSKYLTMLTAIVATVLIFAIAIFWALMGIISAVIYMFFALAVTISYWILYVRLNKKVEPEDVSFAKDFALGIAITLSVFLAIYLVTFYNRIRKIRKTKKASRESDEIE